jgi:hypothetical protein
MIRTLRFLVADRARPGNAARRSGRAAGWAWLGGARRLAMATCVAGLEVATPAAAAELTVGSGASFDLGTALLDLGCADLKVGGTLSAGAVGFDAARDLVIDPGGVLNGDSALLEVTGDWNNAGSFSAGTSTLRLSDGCGVTSAIVSGNTSFANLEMTTTSGKRWSFAAGTTQTVASALTLLGASGNLLEIRSTSAGSVAFFNLLGSQIGDFVDVEDNDATAGVPINVGPNSIVGSNTPGWTIGITVPLLSLLGLLVLAVLLLGSARHGLAARRQPSPVG